MKPAMIREEDPEVMSDGSASGAEDCEIESSMGKSGREFFGEEEDVSKAYELDVAKREDRWVFWARVLTALVLLGVAVSVCLVVYVSGHNAETEAYEQDFRHLAEKLVLTFESNVKQRFEILASFNDGITSEANGSFPFVTPPHFSERAERVAKLAQIMVLHWMPLVTRENLKKWNQYSVENSQWRPEGMARERGIPLNEVNASEYWPVAYNPYVMPGTNVPTQEINPDGPYFPIWLSYPVSDYPLANLDLFSDWEHIVPINKTMYTGKPIFEYSYDYQGHMEHDIRWEFIMGNKFVDYRDDPHATVVVPVFDSFGPDKKVAATLMVYIYWRTYFDNLLPPGADGVEVVLENTCNQTYTYRVDGAESTWLGRGDRHNPKYDFLETGTSLDGILNEGEPEEHAFADHQFEDDTESDILYYDCYYNIRVYPSQEFEDRYRTNKPGVQAGLLAGLFLFTSAVFLFYDYIIEMRQKRVMKSALQSGALVSSLFPAAVREQLYKEQQDKKDAQIKASKTGSWEAPSEMGTEDSSGKSHEGPTAIASLYPETTIFFADLVGFTAWSAKRTPAEVFQLLETIYGCFDGIARRRKVFKVETIGDCYVAVTGLPDPQADHAVIMCKFAHECVRRLNSLLGGLCSSLGEDTAELGMRVGCHSGPVTAGVLRGEKSRFQLFGDSVNTASRMESTGVKGRIHVSQATADALVAAGKEAWLVPREDKVVAKGKGQMDTYFVNLLSTATSTSRSTTSNTSLTQNSSENDAS